MPRHAPTTPTDVLTSTRGGQTAGRLAKLLAPRVAERVQLIAKLAKSCSWRSRTMHECDDAQDELLMLPAQESGTRHHDQR